MSDKAEGAVADAGQTVQKGLNQATDTKDEVTRFIRDNPICAALIAGFIVVHLVMVVLAGPFNELRSMITGWYRLPKEKVR